MTVEKTPVYTCSKLNSLTYLIIHNNKYLEFPYIYLKVYAHPSLLIVVDTGCGAHNAAAGTHVELKDFIEGYILLDIGVKKYEYMVICTHCHFDHVGGIEAFARSGATIVASGNDKEFLHPQSRAANYLCEAFGTPTPGL
jgi:glyoxylase-like metal-dependent hydrolase (beta-lactamase superfamily II)